MKKTFTILHTNDLHSSFIGMGPASDYTPFSLMDHLRKLPVKAKGELPVIPVDENAAEIRAIKAD
jgi:2',3'-cyclic-nucleotide 2'-phosphodiesterase (5'-nucleotidase family)